MKTLILSEDLAKDLENLVEYSWEPELQDFMGHEGIENVREALIAARKGRHHIFSALVRLNDHLTLNG